MNETSGVRVLERAISILSYISSCREPAGLSEIHRATGISKATAFRIMQTLFDHNLLVKNSNSSYQIGPGVLAWVSGFHAQSALIGIARPCLEEINKATLETVHLFSYENGKAFYIDKIESTQPVRLGAVVGASPTLYSTSAGQAILSALPEDEFEAYLAEVELKPRTARTCTEKAAFRRMVEEARARGYAEEDEQNEEGIRCIGAAIRNERGRPIGAISITAPRYRFPDKEVEPRGAVVRDAAASISKSFGYAR